MNRRVAHPIATRRQTTPLRYRLPARRRGMALVIVLLILLLISALILAFFATVTTDHSASNQYSRTVSTQQMADSAVQLVMAQIVDATKGYKVPGNTSSGRLAWASQPGMIRTYGEDGSAFKYFKLYSSTNMIVTNTVAFNAATEIPPDWSAKPGWFIDINQPILVPDPAGSVIPNPARSSDRFRISYPIVDPAAQASPVSSTSTNGIEGFSITGSTAGYSGANPPPPNYNPAGGNPAPMPVRWVYVLENGALTVPDSYDPASRTASWSGGPNTPTKENPICGRIAFWTDDESCKININTAAEGVFWDTPRVNTPQDRQTSSTVFGFALSQPMQHEWQRYPGHPAQTALSTVLFPGLDLTGTDSATLNLREQLYNSVVPRVQGGGSLGGTRKIGTVSMTGVATDVITPDGDRLYANVDELLLAPNPRATNPLITAATVDRARFFLTANSRAPEVNLFNQPRLGMWPISSDLLTTGDQSLFVTTFDKMIATDLTIGGLPYFFQRNPMLTYSSANYPQTRTTASSAQKAQKGSHSTRDDYDNIERNQQLYDYLKNLTSANIPGFGGNFRGKYPQDRDQILTEIFDYIRSTNEYDSSLIQYTSSGAFVGGSPVSSDSLNPGLNLSQDLSTKIKNPRISPRQYTDAAVATNNGGKLAMGNGQVMPIQIGSTQGFGRYFSISEISLALLCSSDPKLEPDSLGSVTVSSSPPYAATCNAVAHTDSRLWTSGSADMPGTRFTDVLGPLLSASEGYGGDLNKDGMVDWKDELILAIGDDADTDVSKGDLNHDGVIDPRDLATFFTSAYRTAHPQSSSPYRVIQPMLLLEPFCASLGYGQINPDMALVVSGLRNLCITNWAGVKQPIFPRDTAVAGGYFDEGENPFEGSGWAGHYDSRSYGGVSGFRSFLLSRLPNQGAAFVGDKIIVKDETSNQTATMQFSSTGNITIRTYFGGNIGWGLSGGNGYAQRFSTGGAGSSNAMTTITTNLKNFIDSNYNSGPSARLIQTINAGFPDSTWPQPKIVRTGTPNLYQSPFSIGVADNGNYGSTPKKAWWNWADWSAARWHEETPQSFSRLGYFNTDANARQYLPNQNSGFAQEQFSFKACNGPAQGGGAVIRVENFAPNADGSPNTGARITPDPADVVRSLVPKGNDQRLIAGRSVVSSDLFVPHPDYYSTSLRFAHALTEAEDNHFGGKWNGMVSGLPVSSYNIQRLSDTPLGSADQGGPDAQALARGDYDNGFGMMRDGAYINKPDDGNVLVANVTTAHPYFYQASADATVGSSYFSPNRKVPSPVMFGSLPSGLISKTPFQTLLFRPATTFSSGYRHPGGGVPADGPPYTQPPDHLLLDLFTMPIVEPYAISEPLSTAGKINMNYQIMPFTYIERSTGIRAVLKNELLTAIPNTAADTYKWRNSTGPGNRVDQTPTHSSPLRYKINLDETLKGFAERFARNDIFRSASEICDIHLVPQIGGVTYSTMESGQFWPDYKLTGDNARERSYANIYGRLTTKSNSFQVHYRVQTLAKSPLTSAAAWVEGKDQVTGEARGSSTIERYVDPNDPSLPDFATRFDTGTEASIDDFYRFRIIGTKRFGQ